MKPNDQPQFLKRFNPLQPWYRGPIYSSGICASPTRKSAQMRFCFHFIFLIVHGVYLPVPPRSLQPLRKNMQGIVCLESWAQPLWEVQQSNRKSRRVSLPRSPLSTLASGNTWPSSDSWSWLSGFLGIPVRSQAVNTIHFLLEFCSVWAGLGSSFWELVFSQPLTLLTPLQRPSNWDLLGLELQTLPHLLYTGFLSFFFLFQDTSLCLNSSFSTPKTGIKKIIKYCFWSWARQ